MGVEAVGEGLHHPERTSLVSCQSPAVSGRGQGPDEGDTAMDLSTEQNKRPAGMEKVKGTLVLLSAV